MSRYELTILDWHPATVNKLLRSVKDRIRLKRQDREIVWGESRRAQIPFATGRRRVSVCFVYDSWQRFVDVDAYHKSLLDALVKADLLRDDSPKWLELGEWTHVRGKGRKTVITLEDIEDVDRQRSTRPGAEAAGGQRPAPGRPAADRGRVR